MNHDTIIALPCGDVCASVDGDLSVVRGLPYAHVRRRFGRSEPVGTSSGVIDSRLFGPAAMQRTTSPTAVVSEDALNMNMWIPRASSSIPRPMVVWLHGGGFEVGSNAARATDGSTLAARTGAVVVSVNYRLDAFGWANLVPAGLHDAHNLGLHDQLTALRILHSWAPWLGCDPSRIVLAGHSAGAFSVAALLSNPQARSLVGSAVMLSGGASRVVPWHHSALIGDRIATWLTREFPGVDLTDVPASALLEATRRTISSEIAERNGTRPRSLGVIDDSGLDDALLPAHPADVVASGAATEVPLLISTCLDEAHSLVADHSGPNDARELASEFAQLGIDAQNANRLATSYCANYPGAGEARTAALTDWIYRLPAARLARAQAGAGGSAYLAVVSGPDPATRAHGSDVAAYFGNATDPRTSARDKGLAATLARFVVSGTTGWRECSADSLRAGIPGAPGMLSEAYDAVDELWAGVGRP